MRTQPECGRRRALLLGGAATLVGCAGGGAAAGGGGGPVRAARAQGGPPPRVAAPAVSLYVPPPCPDRPGDIVGLLLEGPCDEGAVVVFGQAFRRGDLPRGAGLAARAGTAPLRAQIDALCHHEDGSVRHAAVSLAVPRLGPGERRGVMLSRAPEGASPAAASAGETPSFGAEAVLSAHQAVLEIAPRAAEGGDAPAGAPWRVDLVSLWRGASARPWQSGALVAQRRIAVPVPPEAVGGAASMRLLADVSPRADGSLWVDVFLRNDVAQRPNGGVAAYTARLLLDGREALAADVPRHFQYTGWGRLRGSRRGGGPEPVLPLVRHDAAYLAATGAVAPYDLTTGVREDMMVAMAQLAADPRWEQPFFTRGIQPAMGIPGGRPDLGITTMWAAAWLTTGDRRAAIVAAGQAETAANVQWHFWDPEGGRDGSGGWIDVRRWPGFWSDPRGGKPPRGLLQPQPPQRDTGWSPQTSHHPELSYVPYLLTARRAFLDNMGAQAAWCVTDVWPAPRQLHPTVGVWPRDAPERPTADPARDVLIAFRGQLRASAWGLRTVGACGWIAPDFDQNRDYFREVERLNYAWMRRHIPEWTAMQGEPHGYIPYSGFGHIDMMAQFSHEYFGSVVAMAARRGVEDARAILDWMRNFLVGRFFQEANGFPRRDTVAYRIAIGPSPAPPNSAPPQKPFQTWREIGEATRARNLSNDERWRFSQGEYGRLAALSLAMIHHVFDDPRALEAYDWILRGGVPLVFPEHYARVPQHNIAPRNRPRFPARARAACANATAVAAT